MAKVIYKKSIGADRSHAEVPKDIPSFRTRESARDFAKKLRVAGVNPTTPKKDHAGWCVTAKHSGGTLSLGRQKA